MPIYFASKQRSVNEYYGKHDIQSLFITDIIRESNSKKILHFHLLFFK